RKGRPDKHLSGDGGPVRQGNDSPPLQRPESAYLSPVLRLELDPLHPRGCAGHGVRVPGRAIHSPAPRLDSLLRSPGHAPYRGEELRERAPLLLLCCTVAPGPAAGSQGALLAAAVVPVPRA